MSRFTRIDDITESPSPFGQEEDAVGFGADLSAEDAALLDIMDRRERESRERRGLPVDEQGIGHGRKRAASGIQYGTTAASRPMMSPTVRTAVKRGALGDLREPEYLEVRRRGKRRGTNQDRFLSANLQMDSEAKKRMFTLRMEDSGDEGWRWIVEWAWGREPTVILTPGRKPGRLSCRGRQGEAWDLEWGRRSVLVPAVRVVTWFLKGPPPELDGHLYQACYEEQGYEGISEGEERWDPGAFFWFRGDRSMAERRKQILEWVEVQKVAVDQEGPVTLEQIAEAFKVSLGTLYRHGLRKHGIRRADRKDLDAHGEARAEQRDRWSRGSVVRNGETTAEKFPWTRGGTYVKQKR